jgi:hypothetical protein
MFVDRLDNRNIMAESIICFSHFWLLTRTLVLFHGVDRRVLVPSHLRASPSPRLSSLQSLPVVP